MPVARGRGQCLCGAVTLVAHGLGQHVDACHCRMCRTWAGGPLFAVECDGDVTFQGEEHVSVYDSSEWAQRGFCSRCGTHLFYRLKDKPWYAIPAGLLEDQALTLRQQIFIDEKPAYYELANDTPRLTGEEFLAKYASS
ncbi:GFA family protein [Modicisalibacter luteus]|uniref:GFA family protein n=1 Tax=Modicisalibacter luteus TaxID=453962 RepID=A0ABV7LZ31_9GAMM|nr:GFA family protein [Halomonas lutea]GHA95925.1 aldehyde-activating protein [Halomonas lutea]